MLYSGFIILLILFADLKVSASASESEFIPEDAIELDGHCYKLYELNTSWEEAQKYFESIGGHLATITSKEENDFVYNYISTLGYKSAYFGATDKENEGVWTWITGEEFIYNNWHNNEPNNERGDEDYVMFYYKYPDGTWNDGGIKTVNANLSKTPFICEWDNLDIIDNNQDDNQEEVIHTEPNNQDNNKDLENDNLQNVQHDSNTYEKNDNKGLTIEIHITNLSLIGGISIFGGVSFVGIIIKKKKKQKNRRGNSSNTQ